MTRFISLPHSVTCTDTSQLCCKRIKARPDVFLGLSVMFKFFLCLKKKVNSNVLEITSDKSGSVIRDYLLGNYVVNV